MAHDAALGDDRYRVMVALLNPDPKQRLPLEDALLHLEIILFGLDNAPGSSRSGESWVRTQVSKLMAEAIEWLPDGGLPSVAVAEDDAPPPALPANFTVWQWLLFVFLGSSRCDPARVAAARASLPRPMK